MKLLSARFPDQPNFADWRIYDHCAVVTRLYSVFAAFVEDVLEEWLSFLSRLTAKYEDLNERIRDQHRDGVGRLLSQLQRRRYRTLTAAQVIGGLHQALNGAEAYELLPQAYFAHDRNYSPEMLAAVFLNAGVDNVTQWMDGHRLVRYFIVNVRVDSTTFEAELKNFLEYRNDAAHGRVDNFLGTEALLQFADFVEAVSGALVERLLEEFCKLRDRRGETVDCGVITEVFTKAGAVVAQIASVSIRTGEAIILRGERFCRFATVQSLQLNDVDVEIVNAETITEVGLRLGQDVREGLRLCKVPIQAGSG
jgi:MAE_28990/MAE_18760-like HEPN